MSHHVTVTVRTNVTVSDPVPRHEVHEIRMYDGRIIYWNPQMPDYPPGAWRVPRLEPQSDDEKSTT